MDAVVEHLDQRLDDDRSHAGVAQRQGVGTHQQHGAHGRLVQLGTHAGRVAAHQIELELLDLIGRNHLSLKRPKPVVMP